MFFNACIKQIEVKLIGGDLYCQLLFEYRVEGSTCCNMLFTESFVNKEVSLHVFRLGNSTCQVPDFYKTLPLPYNLHFPVALYYFFNQ